ncbi:MAG: MFS transporter [Spirochaetia bacterium]|nr:MFS transporter [Spirochaetia bacterium]
MDPSEDRRRAALAAFIFFLLLCSYYILRPVRDEMGVQSGNAKLPWLFTATFVSTLIAVPLLGLIARLVPQQILVPSVFGFFVLNIAAFYIGFLNGASGLSAGIFFVWLSLFNLLAVSLFWSKMGDVFSESNAKRMYGLISAGGTLGALAGPGITTILARSIGVANLLGISAALLAIATACIYVLKSDRNNSRPIGGSILSGVQLAFGLPLRRIAVLVICYSTISTLMYVTWLDEVSNTISDSGARTSYFASWDLLTNLLALGIQTLVTARLARGAGFKITLIIVPFIILLSLMVLGVSSILPFTPLQGVVSVMTLLAIAQTINRAGDYSLMKPAREMIYATVDAERRYKAKSFIDTAVYRACDAGGSWLMTGLKVIGAPPLLLAGIPIALIWFFTGYRTGKAQDEVHGASHTAA